MPHRVSARTTQPRGLVETAPLLEGLRECDPPETVIAPQHRPQPQRYEQAEQPGQDLFRHPVLGGERVCTQHGLGGHRHNT